MKSFQWGSNYLTGILSVDEQHKELGFIGRITPKGTYPKLTTGSGNSRWISSTR